MCQYRIHSSHITLCCLHMCFCIWLGTLDLMAARDSLSGFPLDWVSSGLDFLWRRPFMTTFVCVGLRSFWQPRSWSYCGKRPSEHINTYTHTHKLTYTNTCTYDIHIPSMCKVSLLFLPLFLLGSLQSDCTLFKLCAGLETKMLVCGRNIILRILFSLERRKYVRRHWKAWSYVVCYVLRADLSPPVDMVTSNIQVSPHTFGESIFCVSCCVPVFLIMCKKRYPSSSLSPSFSSFFLFLSLSSSSSFSFIQETPSPVQGMRVGLNLRRSDRRCLA